MSDVWHEWAALLLADYAAVNELSLRPGVAEAASAVEDLAGFLAAEHVADGGGVDAVAWLRRFGGERAWEWAEESGRFTAPDDDEISLN